MAARSIALACVLALAGCEAEGHAEPRARTEPIDAPEPATLPTTPAPPITAPEPATLPPTPAPPTASASAPEPAPAPPRTLVTRTLRSTSLSLALHPDGTGELRLLRDGTDPAPIPCDRLTGAWGLWIDDVDDDGRAEAIVALHKPARFDPAPHNRLHVYGFEDGRCVPAWRGTRLAGRFDAVATDPDDRGAILVHEWLSPARRRVARYRWRGFGYAVDRVLWEGTGEPPPALAGVLDFGPSPYSIAPTGDP
jgi:hypothetical protein